MREVPQFNINDSLVIIEVFLDIQTECGMLFHFRFKIGSIQFRRSVLNQWTGAFMQTYFTSDNHFDHKNIIQYSNRPFKNVDEMNVMMVEKWNSIVTNHDTVYHLGDFTLGDIRHFTKCVCQLNGNIKILPGSHDHLWLKDFVASDKVQVVMPLVSVEFPEIMIGKYPQVIVMCHYSMQVWDRSHYGAWHLFGHSHGTLKGIGLSFDVGVDCTEFTPLSLEMVALKMAHLEPHAPDRLLTFGEGGAEC